MVWEGKMRERVYVEWEVRALYISGKLEEMRGRVLTLSNAIKAWELGSGTG